MDAYLFKVTRSDLVAVRADDDVVAHMKAVLGQGEVVLAGSAEAVELAMSYDATEPDDADPPVDNDPPSDEDPPADQDPLTDPDGEPPPDEDGRT